jgi:TM2 domain-containing membrane protein YozV
MFMPRQNLLKPQTSSVFRNKVTLGLLAALLGGVGAHWWYLKRPYAWLVSASSVVLIGLASQANVWWENPAFFLLFIPILDGFIEAVVWCPMSDERFDALLNPGLQRFKPSG